MRVGIDLQHNGRRSVTGPSRLGFKDPLGEGKNEYWWLAQYGVGIQLRLNELGHLTYINGMNEYSDRAKRFNSLSCNLVVLCHVNQNIPEFRGKPRGNRAGRIFYDYRTSDLNKRRIRKAASYLDDLLPWGFTQQEARPDDWTVNAFNVQRGYKAWTWCFEPFFGDQKPQREWIENYYLQGDKLYYKGPMAFGALVANAIHEAYAK